MFPCRFLMIPVHHVLNFHTDFSLRFFYNTIINFTRTVFFQCRHTYYYYGKNISSYEFGQVLLLIGQLLLLTTRSINKNGKRYVSKSFLRVGRAVFRYKYPQPLRLFECT